MSRTRAAELAATTSGTVWSATDSDRSGYDEQRHGFNLTLKHRPDLILAAADPADIAAGIRFAAESDLPVDVHATGHGANRAMDRGLLITTRALADVRVDPATATARIQAGATAGVVTAAAARYGLTAPVGAAPGVGYVSYTLGGGLGPLGRSLGYAADPVRRLYVVTADGRELTVTRDQHPDLFWALRGGGGNLAAVIALETDLQPAPEFCGGGLFYPGEQAADVLEAFRRCTTAAPSELSLSLAVLTYPDRPALPPALRGRYCCHVRVAYLGSPEVTRRLTAPLRELSPFLDTVTGMPLTDIGTIHADRTTPMPVNNNSLALNADVGAAFDQVLPLLHADTPFMLELRQLGGALSAAHGVDNAVGHRAAGWNLFTSAYPGTDPAAAARAQQHVHDVVTQFSVGGPLRNFLPAGQPDAAICYEAPIADRLSQLKPTWDPADTFRFAPPIRAAAAAAGPSSPHPRSAVPTIPQEERP